MALLLPVLVRRPTYLNTGLGWLKYKLLYILVYTEQFFQGNSSINEQLLVHSTQLFVIYIHVSVRGSQVAGIYTS